MVSYTTKMIATGVAFGILTVGGYKPLNSYFPESRFSKETRYLQLLDEIFVG